MQTTVAVNEQLLKELRVKIRLAIKQNTGMGADEISYYIPNNSGSITSKDLEWMCTVLRKELPTQGTQRFEPVGIVLLDQYMYASSGIPEEETPHIWLRIILSHQN